MGGRLRRIVGWLRHRARRGWATIGHSTRCYGYYVDPERIDAYTKTEIDFRAGNGSQPAILTALGAVFVRAQTRYRWNDLGKLDSLAANVPPYEWNPYEGEWNYAPSLAISTRWTRSADVSNASWTKTGCTANPGTTTTSPDPALTAMFVAEAATTALHEVSRTQVVSASGQGFYMHFIVKMVGRNYVALDFKNTNGVFAGNTVVFGGMLTNPYVFSNPSGITAEVIKRGDGWVEIGVAAFSLAAATATCALVFCDDNGVPSTTTPYLGDVTKGCYWFQGQNYATAYMPPPVVTAASNITIAADDYRVPLSAFAGFGPMETFLAEVRTRQFLSSSIRIIASTGVLADNNTSNRSALYINLTGTGVFTAGMTSGGGTTNSVSQGIGSGMQKVAGSYRLNLVSIAVNGSKIGRVRGNFPRPVGVDTLYIGQSSSKTQQWSGWMRKLTIYHKKYFDYLQMARQQNG
jgi:hypothetical protein